MTTKSSDAIYERIRQVGRTIGKEVLDNALMDEAAKGEEDGEGEDSRKSELAPQKAKGVDEASRKLLQVFEKSIPAPPDPVLPSWKELAAKRQRPAEDDDGASSGVSNKRRKSNEKSPAHDGKQDSESSQRQPVARGTSDSVAEGAKSAISSASKEDDGPSAMSESRRPSSSSASERGRHHKHEAEKIQGEQLKDSKNKTLRNLHYLAAATFFMEHAFRSPAIEKTTQDFINHVVRGLSGEDPTLIDLGKRLDGIYGIYRVSRRQASVENLANVVQRSLLADDEKTWKGEAEKLCHQVLFLKEDYSSAKHKWRELDNAKDTPPETSRLNAFGDPSKALITARQVLSKYAEKKGFAFSIVA